MPKCIFIYFSIIYTDVKLLTRQGFLFGYDTLLFDNGQAAIVCGTDGWKT